ncbi:hypothetical protein Z043_113751 [Scleropages formosus]|uniref:Uncharacterized protein n=1 Tax=Scleropages formosus TaxID=113540 RepID=A0A0N8JYW0_SCLFO|nr:hypothetical protein Z043_113751 [Scleropages formosus]
MAPSIPTYSYQTLSPATLSPAAQTTNGKPNFSGTLIMPTGSQIHNGPKCSIKGMYNPSMAHTPMPANRGNLQYRSTWRRRKHTRESLPVSVSR